MYSYVRAYSERPCISLPISEIAAPISTAIVHLTPLTKDHSLVYRLVEAKQIEPDDIYTHPQRNLIYRSLGAGHKSVDPDVFNISLQPGDSLLLCSDGLWEMVRNNDLLKVLEENTDPQKICDTLIDMANTNGGEDNITAVLVQIH